jgi:hypothetical protein
MSALDFFLDAALCDAMFPPKGTTSDDWLMRFIELCARDSQVDFETELAVRGGTDFIGRARSLAGRRAARTKKKREPRRRNATTGTFISKPHGATIFIAEFVREGSTRLKWSRMPEISGADLPIDPRKVPLAIRREARDFFRARQAPT